MWYGKICTPRAASSHLWMDAHTSDNTPTHTATALSIKNNIIPLNKITKNTVDHTYMYNVLHMYILFTAFQFECIVVVML